MAPPPPPTTPTSKFSSEGFDLDAASEDVVLEVGGGITRVEKETKSTREPRAGQESQDHTVTIPGPLAKADEFKALGNENFKNGAYLEAYDMYTEAILACPGMTGDEILKEKAVFEEAQHEKALEQQRMMDQQRRTKGTAKVASSSSSAATTTTTTTSSSNEELKSERPPTLEPYQAPHHEFGTELAVYHCNRAAVCLHLKRHDEAISDCDVAVLLNPTYTKAWMRRSAAYESTERLEEALRDAKQAQSLEPSNANIRKTVQRLQKLEDERLEQLKEETMGKLKELGNTILGNFGLSLDNFNATKGPDGNYSISFNQGKQK